MLVILLAAQLAAVNGTDHRGGFVPARQMPAQMQPSQRTGPSFWEDVEPYALPACAVVGVAALAFVIIARRSR